MTQIPGLGSAKDILYKPLRSSKKATSSQQKVLRRKGRTYRRPNYLELP